MKFKLAANLLAAIFVICGNEAVDRNKFRTCQQSSFCRRCRGMEPGTSVYSLDVSTLQVSSGQAEVMLKHDEDRFRMEISALKNGVFRVKIREAFPLVPRFEVPEVLVSEPELDTLTLDNQNDKSFTLKSGSNKVEVVHDPLRLDFYSNGILVVSANARQLMRFEATKEKTEENNNDEQGTWEESFSGNTDSKPRGPQAVAMDFTFVGSKHLFGVPEHADRFSLVDTSVTDPYRLYNLDVFEYELWNAMALYASIPFIMSHNAKRSSGLFWLNAAETWVDIRKEDQNGGFLGSLFGSSKEKEDATHAHFMSEAGIIDAFVLLGPGPKDISTQYAGLTGSTPLPPMFSIAYQQCRWNYNDQEDVRMVADKFDEHDMPMDVMWLDIEHTDGKKYFTWDARKFPDSVGMIQNLTAVGRKLVTIVDPHIKKDQSYWVHKELTDLGLYVKNKDGNDYEGWCWPGASYYPDFLKPEAREYFSEQYMLDNYKGSTLDLFTWNDMNEPSVFNGPEVTMPKDLMHVGNVEHRELHNIYGHLYVMGTHAGHLKRSNNELRPFILTRSAFAGTQRYAAIWTGDNTAEWGHLEASVPMCLSLSISGIAHCGADVGGFFGNPDGSLFVRWYQAGAWQPFFRSHAHIDTKRREPWLYSKMEMALIREALRWRYSYLPYWYTMFHHTEVTGVPPMRPIFYEFPEDENAFGIDNEYMLGEGLLVHPISKPDVRSENVYLPGPNQYWYDIFTGEQLDHHGDISVPVHPDRIPIYQKGGSIIPKKERVRRSSALMANDPVTLIVALNKQNEARGTLYMDDGATFNYRTKSEFSLIEFDFSKNKLTGHLKSKPGFQCKSWLERVVIYGVQEAPKEAKIVSPMSGEETLKVSYEDKVLTVRRPGVNICADWELTLIM
eukprot:01923.XXX_16815_20980_1 [CDS] Oithona nana genome sequencing.